MTGQAPSLRRRLTLGVGALVATLTALGLALGGIGLRQALEGVLLERLQHDLDAVIAATTVAGGTLRLHEDQLVPVYAKVYSGHYFRVSEGSDVLRSRSLWDADLPVPELAAGERWQGGAQGPARQPLLILAQGVRRGERTLVVAVAEDVSSIDRWQWRLLAGSVLFGLLVLAAILVAQSVLVRHALRPLNQVSAQLRRLQQGELAVLPTAGVPAEVLPLVERLNAALELLVARLERSRKALGNLAHALKTPLTVLTQLGDELAAPQRARLEQQVRAMHATVERELKRARLAGAATPGQRFDLRADLAALADTLARIYHGKALRIDIDAAPDASFAGDREDFLELMGVLLDNACKWARARVAVRVALADGLLVSVEDDGPGASAEQMATLTARGQRLDESTPGAGLGLSIAADIVEQYGASMNFERAALGGLRVVLRLPAL